VIQQSGPSNLRRYKVAVYFREKRLAIGEGGSIQQAEMNAAVEALENSGVFMSYTISCVSLYLI